MNGRAVKSTSARILALLPAIGTTVADDLRAATISIKPNKLTRVYTRQADAQFPWLVRSVSGAASFSCERDIPVGGGGQTTGLRYVHECPLPSPDPCDTSVGIWQVKASCPKSLRLLYSGSWGEYDMGRWVDASKLAGVEIADGENGVGKAAAEDGTDADSALRDAVPARLFSKHGAGLTGGTGMPDEMPDATHDHQATKSPGFQPIAAPRPVARPQVRGFRAHGAARWHGRCNWYGQTNPTRRGS